MRPLHALCQRPCTAHTQHTHDGTLRMIAAGRSACGASPLAFDDTLLSLSLRRRGGVLTHTTYRASTRGDTTQHAAATHALPIVYACVLHTDALPTPHTLLILSLNPNSTPILSRRPPKHTEIRSLSNKNTTILLKIDVCAARARIDSGSKLVLPCLLLASMPQ